MSTQSFTGTGVSDVGFPESVRVIDSHTEGEPTRVVVAGFPSLAGDTMRARAADFAARWPHLRRAIVCEPRGHEAMVGALLTPPEHRAAAAGVIFFNNVGLLGMCGHGLIGVVRTLHALGRLDPGTVHVDTPVGRVSALLGADEYITIHNVPARVAQLDVPVDVPEYGVVRGDVAWGGNWFFLTDHAPVPLDLAHLPELTRFAQTLKRALVARGVTGDDGAEIDHIEITGPAVTSGVQARNFVLCPGDAYDRSPCGTGTSAKLAALHARGLLAAGARWAQESITGGRFTAWLEAEGDVLVPHVRGRAFITAETVLRFDAADPFRTGFTGTGA